MSNLANAVAVLLPYLKRRLVWCLTTKPKQGTVIRGTADMELVAAKIRIDILAAGREIEAKLLTEAERTMVNDL